MAGSSAGTEVVRADSAALVAAWSHPTSLAAEAASSRREESVTSSIMQIEFLNAELMTAAAERFKLVAAMQGEQRRQRSVFSQQKSILENKLQEKEALAATQGLKIKQLEGVRDQLDKRVRVIEALLTSEREAAERKTRRTADGPPETAAARAAG